MKQTILFLLFCIAFLHQSFSQTIQERKPETVLHPGIPPGMPPPGNWPFKLGAHDKAGIYISDGERVAENEYTDNEVSISVANGASGISGENADGVLITSSTYDATGIVVADGGYTLGGDKDYYTVNPNIANDYVGSTVSSTVDPSSETNFNSVLLFTLGEDIPKDATTGSSGVEANNKDEVVYLNNVYLQVDGAQRYVSSTFSDATTVVNDSYLISTGNADGHTDEIELPFSNEALLISGAARTNFTIGSAQTYYINSTVVAEGWASLSTDAAAPEGLDLYAYNSKAYALNGGYGTYADFFCRVWLYGTYLEAAEIGGILSKSGEINVMDGGSAPENVVNYNTGATTSNGSLVRAGRNALMIHAPDMRGEGLAAVDHGTVNVVNSTLETSNNVQSNFDFMQYGKSASKYVEYVTGDVILVKSTSTTVNLDNATLISSNGVLFHTVLNSDRMGNFLSANDNKAKDDDGNIIVKPVILNMANMIAEGDILHDDHQRNMAVSMKAVNLTGRIDQGTYASWKAFWSDQGVDEAYWLSPDWDGSNELAVSIDGNSSWTVTGSSAMSSLTIADGPTISAPSGSNLTMTVDGEETAIAAGSYSGNIILYIN